MDEHRPATKIAERLFTRPNGATMAEITAATGGPQYNVLKKLEGLGYRIHKTKEKNTTRYFAEAPDAQAFESTVTRNGQITIPKEVRQRLGLEVGDQVRFEVDRDNQVVLRPCRRSILDSVGVLPRPKRAMTFEEMDEAIANGATRRYLRSKR
jgi:AbrB family looped-hinge helix DNA binding protein